MMIHEVISNYARSGKLVNKHSSKTKIEKITLPILAYSITGW